MKLIKYSIPYFKRRPYSLLLFIICNIALTAVSISLSYISGKLVDILAVGGDYAEFFSHTLLIAICFALNLLLGYINKLSDFKLNIDLPYMISKDIIKHVHNVPLLRTFNINHIYLNQRVSQDAGSVIKYAVSVVTGFLVNAMTIIIMSLLIVDVSVKLAFVIGVFLILYIALYLILAKSFYVKGFEYKEAQNEYFAKMSEQFAYIEYIKIHSLKDLFSYMLEEAYKSFRKVALGLHKFLYISTAFETALTYTANITLVLIGGVEVLEGRLSLGMYVIISGYFPKLLSSCKYFFQLGKTYQDARIAFDRLQEFNQWDTEECGVTIPKAIDSILIEKLKVSYPGNKILSYKDQLFEKGKIYSISGANGVGKSTFFQALIGMFVSEMNGSVQYSGVSIKDCNMEYIRHCNIGLSEQEPLLISGSIKLNLLLGRQASEEELEKVLHAVNLQNYIQSLPLKLDTIITSKNNNLSGGEKQKISIARTLLNDPEIMLFDEPTSALDSETINIFLNHLAKIKHNKIIIIVSHDRSVMNYCDIAINLDEK